MLDGLANKLQKILRNLSGQGRVSERHVEETAREIRNALLDADVHFKLAKEFVERVKQRALGQEVIQSLTPGQQVIRVVRDELVELLGGEQAGLSFSRQPPSVFLMVGLQGSGKTTSSAKLARWLSKNNHTPLLVSVDVYRPAAVEQLRVLCAAHRLGWFDDPGDQDPVSRAEKGLRHARNGGYDVLIIDTAGRLHIDDEMMLELDRIRKATSPVEVLLVADAMTGQDAVRSAREFHEKMGLTGVILTKMDGDARGGAALSIKSVTGQSIKFVGTGENVDALEPFFPDRLAGRILGMGDVLSLIEKAEDAVDREQAEAMAEKIRKDEFTLEDFRDQLRQIRKMGPLEQILGMLPNMGPLRGLGQMKVDEKELIHIEAIIDSMTRTERRNHQILNGARKKRIARGSGRPVSEINQLLKQYVETRKMMRSLSRGIMPRLMKGMKFPR
ncbi:MAG: signal recognition particle protein [Acidobacteriota bacterium]|jgi:signal recognition particle subunit SRP54|nr:signal recognition particle protein [Acidobacteriota bacterium]NLT33384.1 signal recognition particle protein [Acidobacteriota bacterium]